MATVGAQVREVFPRGGGYVPLRSYAAIGDGRSVALVGEDGRIDWLSWPDLDSPAVFGAMLDAEAGGWCLVAPAVPFRVARRYLPQTNVLETTFVTGVGSVRLLDAMTLAGQSLGPSRELQRRVEGVSGRVPMTWVVRPRFGFAQRATRFGWRMGAPVATAGSDALAVRVFEAGVPQVDEEQVGGSFVTAPGSAAVIALSGAHQEPLVFPSRVELDTRFAQTTAAWQSWIGSRAYTGSWAPAVIRSALALKLLVFAPSGAVAAAATTSLPEQIGGERNWDYRFCWVRDASFTMAALLRLGCAAEAQAYFWWLVQATQLTQPRLQPLYRLDGGAHARERILPLSGYLGSRPVRVGNAAAAQLQLDGYGELLATAWLYAEAGGRIDPDIGRRLGAIADLVGRIWALPDAGIWEVRSAPAHFTHSKMMCWVALDRADRLAARGLIPGRHRAGWAEQAAACQDFIETRCYSSALGSYTRAAGSQELDASVLLGLLAGYGDPRGPRWRASVEAIREGLGHGPYLYRYTGEDGLSGAEGAFLSCSFWLAEAMARTGRGREAAELMDQLVGLANDVGLYAEEIDPASGAFLGNLPQGLSHLALISAATAITQEASR
ncbi:MAG TPA: glycoside hydrolase family 15 protein [Marmoricola sp.]|nr:glycoside hydrolase family 15 protein [Marmoricola sp.]